MPRLMKKHLTPLQYPELRLIAMLGMNMDVKLAYSGDTDNIFKWICDNQDRFSHVDIKALARPKKAGKPGPLRTEVVNYVQRMQRYLQGEGSLPNWAQTNLEEQASTEKEENSMNTENRTEYSTPDGEYNFPNEWLTKAGTPDKRKAVVRAVLNGDMTLEEAIANEREENSKMKYIPKTSNNTSSENVLVRTPDFGAPASASAEETDVKAKTGKKVAFKKKSITKKAPVQNTEPVVDNTLVEDINVMKERLNYVSSALTDLKQSGFDRQQSLTEEILEIKNALLFVINSVVLEEGSVDSLTDIPTPDEY